MRTNPGWLILALFGSALLGGCYEPSNVTVYEPGEYKGVQDPLLQQDADERAEILAERFQSVQTDR